MGGFLFLHTNYCFSFVQEQVSQIHSKSLPCLSVTSWNSSETSCRVQAEGYCTIASVGLMLTSENETKQNLIFVTYCLPRLHVKHVRKSRAYYANTQQNGSELSWWMRVMFKRKISFDTLHRVSDRKNTGRSLSSAFMISIISKRHKVSTHSQIQLHWI